MSLGGKLKADCEAHEPHSYKLFRRDVGCNAADMRAYELCSLKTRVANNGYGDGKQDTFSVLHGL